jgi:hypothetical protein
VGCTVPWTIAVDFWIMSTKLSFKRVEPGNGAKQTAARAEMINLRML